MVWREAACIVVVTMPSVEISVGRRRNTCLPPAGSGCGGYQRFDGILFSLAVGLWTVTGGERSLRARWILMTKWRKTVE
jgi:hypothetical protein